MTETTPDTFDGKQWFVPRPKDKDERNRIQGNALLLFYRAISPEHRGGIYFEEYEVDEQTQQMFGAFGFREGKTDSEWTHCAIKRDIEDRENRIPEMPSDELRSFLRENPHSAKATAEILCRLYS